LDAPGHAAVADSLGVESDAIAKHLNVASCPDFIEIVLTEDDVWLDATVPQSLNYLSNCVCLADPYRLLHSQAADSMQSPSQPDKRSVIVNAEIDIYLVLKEWREFAVPADQREDGTGPRSPLPGEGLFELAARPRRIRKIVSKYNAREARPLECITDAVIEALAYLEFPFVQPHVDLTESKVLGEFSYKNLVPGTVTEKQIRLPV